MKAINVFFTALLLMTVVVSCQRDTYESELESKLNLFLKNEKVDYEYVIIIPGSGCTGCITNAENYFLSNVGNNKIKFVFTNNFSKKQLFIKLKKTNLQRSNIFIDNDNYFYLIDYDKSIYPYRAKVINKEIVEVKML